MATQTNRRALLGAALLTPIVAACGATAVTAAGIDPRWRALADDYRAKYAAWYSTIDLQDEADQAFYAACKSLPPEPIEPKATSVSMMDLTLRQIRDATDTPEHQANWVAYERDHKAWEAQRDAVRETFTGPAKMRYEQAWTARSEALDAVTGYRVTSLHDRAEKIEIFQAEYDGFDAPPEYVAAVLADVRHLAGRAA